VTIEEKVRPLRMRIRFHLNRMQAEQADEEILAFARDILERAAQEADRVSIDHNKLLMEFGGEPHTETSNSWCEDYGCGDFRKLAECIRALLPPAEGKS